MKKATLVAALVLAMAIPVSIQAQEKDPCAETKLIASMAFLDRKLGNPIQEALKMFSHTKNPLHKKIVADAYKLPDADIFTKRGSKQGDDFEAKWYMECLMLGE